MAIDRHQLWSYPGPQMLILREKLVVTIVLFFHLHPEDQAKISNREYTIQCLICTHNTTTYANCPSEVLSTLVTVLALKNNQYFVVQNLGDEKKFCALYNRTCIVFVCCYVYNGYLMTQCHTYGLTTQFLWITSVLQPLISCMFS